MYFKIINMRTLYDLIEEEKENNPLSLFNNLVLVDTNRFSLKSNTYTFIFINRNLVRKCIDENPNKYIHLHDKFI